jgi:hypothetical protein
MIEGAMIERAGAIGNLAALEGKVSFQPSHRAVRRLTCPSALVANGMKKGASLRIPILRRPVSQAYMLRVT